MALREEAQPHLALREEAQLLALRDFDSYHLYSQDDVHSKGQTHGTAAAGRGGNVGEREREGGRDGREEGRGRGRSEGMDAMTAEFGGGAEMYGGGGGREGGREGTEEEVYGMYARGLR